MRSPLFSLLGIVAIVGHCAYAMSSPLDEQCASFDTSSLILRTPCLYVAEFGFEVDLSLATVSPPLYLDVMRLIQTSRAGPLCANFDIPSNHLIVPCLYVGSSCYQTNFILNSVQPIRFELVGIAQRDGPAEISGLLSALRNEIVSQVPVDVRQAVESFASAYPIQPSEGTDPIAVQGSGGEVSELTVSVGRRDWAYALKGVEFTFIGVFGEGQASFLDAALWCFLEAALLRMDESEHLTNVAFHLNERGEYAAARRILEFALLLDPTAPGLNNNLAYAFAKQGGFSQAINHALASLKEEQGISFLLLRLGHYLQSGGFNDPALIALTQEPVDGTLLPPEVDWSALSDLGKSVYVDLLNKASEFWVDVWEANRPDPAVNNTVEAMHALIGEHIDGNIFNACLAAVNAACEGQGLACGVAGRCDCIIEGFLSSYQIARQILDLLQQKHVGKQVSRYPCSLRRWLRAWI